MKLTTKEKIVYESFKLFAEKGYDSVSTRMIAKTVGIADSALYKHFSSKQELLDAILTECKERFLQHVRETSFLSMNRDDLMGICMGFYEFQTTDEWVSGFRKILMMEQFRNEHARQQYRTFFIDMPVKGQTAIFSKLIEEGKLKNCDPEVMSMELYAPFFLYHTWDSEENRTRLRKHVEQFINEYEKEK